MRNFILYEAFEYIQRVNVERCQHWHPGGLEEWSTLEWAAAMCGEAGEAANVAKKIKRVDSDMANAGGQTREKLVDDLAWEIADTFLYLQLLAARENINLYDAIQKKFNHTSEVYGFPERLLAYPKA